MWSEPHVHPVSHPVAFPAYVILLPEDPCQILVRPFKICRWIEHIGGFGMVGKAGSHMKRTEMRRNGRGSALEAASSTNPKFYASGLRRPS